MNRMLYADDDVEMHLLAEIYFEPQGWQVTAVSSGEEALTALALGTYDVLVMDRSMPGMGGAAAAVAARDAGHVLPIMIWSGYTAPEQVAALAARDVGVMEKGDPGRMLAWTARFTPAVPLAA